MALVGGVEGDSLAGIVTSTDHAIWMGRL